MVLAPLLAHAAPRVALVFGQGTPAEVAVARVTLEGAGMDVQAVDDKKAPLSADDAQLWSTHKELERVLGSARASFVATRFAEARAQIGAAEKLAAPLAGHPDIARALALLDLVAAQCGDATAYAAAAAHDEALTLDVATYSPDVRRAYARAVAERARPARVVVHLTGSAGAIVFVDGVSRGTLPVDLSLAPGLHALYASGPALGAVHRAFHVDRETTIPLPLVPRTDLPSALRAHALGRTPIDGPELVSAADSLGVDAVVTAQLDEHHGTAATAGATVAFTRVEQEGDRATILASLMRSVADAIHRACALEHVPPPRGRAGGAIELPTTIGPCVANLRATFRTSTSKVWQTRTTSGNEHAPLRLAPLPSSDRPYDLEYYLVADGAHGNAVNVLRDASSPFRIPLDANLVRHHWYGKWWIWTIAGVVVAGAVTTAVVLTTRPVPDVRLGGP